MSTADITAVIPTSGRPSLRRAVSSVLRQTQASVPLVVLDDPDALSVVRRRLDGLDYGLVLTAGRQGAAAARNLGARLAETPYVAFLDDDDEWLAEKSRLQQSDAGAETVVSSRAMLVGSTSRIVPEQIYHSRTTAETLADYVLDRSTIRLRRHFIQTSSLFCTRQAVMEVPWAEALPRHQDWDWLIRLESAGLSIRQRSDVLVRVFQGSQGSISRSPDWQASRAWIDSLGERVSDRAAGDFLASVVARGAFESRAWGEGARTLLQSLRGGAHRSAVLVGMSGMMSRGGLRG